MDHEITVKQLSASNPPGVNLEILRSLGNDLQMSDPNAPLVNVVNPATGEAVPCIFEADEEFDDDTGQTFTLTVEASDQEGFTRLESEFYLKMLTGQFENKETVRQAQYDLLVEYQKLIQHVRATEITDEDRQAFAEAHIPAVARVSFTREELAALIDSGNYAIA